MVLVLHPEKNNCVVTYSQDIVKEDTKDEDEMKTKITKETEKTWKRTMKRTMTRTKKIETKDDEDYEPEEPGAAKEVVPAQEFDVKLEREKWQSL